MIKHVRYSVFGCADPAKAIPFLVDFGLAVSAERPDAVYFRGADQEPYVLVLKKTEKQGLIAVGYEVDSEENLQSMAKRLGCAVSPISDNSWGGLRAVTADCDGNGIELVYGIQPVKPLPMPRDAVVFNSNGQMRRKGRLPVFEDAPTPVLHLCHVVHESPDVRRFIDWYVSNLGAYPSDILTSPQDSEIPAASFLRFPRGTEWVDHHNVAVFASKKVGVQHVCFEALDLDAIFMAHRYLKDKGYHQAWGPVRHNCGGAISDYWVSPWGLQVEHVTDGDIVNDECKTQVQPLSERSAFQWTTQPLPPMDMPVDAAP